MKKKIKTKKKLLVSMVGLFAIICMINPIKSNAALQANKNPGVRAKIGEWLPQIRKMEATGGTLGLTDDTINESTLTSTTKNDLDIHMQKNTEYGAMAILSASAYGNQNKINDGETTTGNKTGIYIKLNKELVSAGKIEYNTVFPKVNAKYKDSYDEQYVRKVGDAITETKGWHDSKNFEWINRNDTSTLLRAYSDSIFSYYGIGNNEAQSETYHTKAQFYTRACIVIGNDF